MTTTDSQVFIDGHIHSDAGTSSISLDITPLYNQLSDLKFLVSFESALLFSILVFLAFDKALGRFLKK